MLKRNIVGLMIIFFIWGFVVCLNDLLTPIMKSIFLLNQFQANLVAFVFFIAYFIGSVAFNIFNRINRLDFKSLMLLGFVISGCGSLFFIPAATIENYWLFLLGLFGIGLGFYFIQISATPLALTIGSTNNGVAWLNLAEGFNSLAYTIAPVIGVYVLFTIFSVNIIPNNLKFPYIYLSLFFFLMAILIWKWLHFAQSESIVNTKHKKLDLIKNGNFVLGMISIFFYVGAEVTIGVNLISYMISSPAINLTTSAAGILLSFYWGGAMIGRFLAGISFSGLSKAYKLTAMLSTLIVLNTLLLYITKTSIVDLKYYFAFEILCLLILWFINNTKIVLIIFSLVNIFNLIIAVNIVNSSIAIWSLLAIGIFNSIMWPNLFDLSLSGLDKYRKEASSLLVMMIIGGAIFPLLQGYIADKSNIAFSYYLPLFAYLYIGFYSMYCHIKKSNPNFTG